MRFYAWAAIIALLWLTMMERAVHALFVVSLAALGISPTLLAIPLLFSAFVYPLGLHKTWPHDSRLLNATTFIALAAIVTTLFALSAWSVIAAAVAVLALTVLLFDAIARLGAAMVIPAVTAVLLAILLRVINNTVALGLTDRGTLLLLLLVGCAAVLRWTIRYEDKPRTWDAHEVRSGAVVITFLLAEYALLGTPSALATFHAQDAVSPEWWYFTLLLTCQLGLLIGVLFAARLNTDRIVVAGAAAANFACVGILVSGIAYIAAPAWILIAQGTAVMLLAAGLSGNGHAVARAGKTAGSLQVAWWVLVVLHAFASKWSFLPSFMGPILRDRATFYLLLSFTLLPLAALLATTPAASARFTARPMARWGPMLGVATLSMLILGNTISVQQQPPPPRNAALRLMTLNAQFFMTANGRVNSNLDALSDLIDVEQPDVIALQESDANSPTGASQNGVLWLSRAHGLNYHYGPPTSAYTPGVALLSRWPITSARYVMLPAEHSMARGVVEAVVEAPGGPIQVIVAHVQWAEQPGEAAVGNREDQVAQTAAILRLIRTDMPSVLLGDFNAGPGYPGPAYGMLSDSFTDAWNAAGRRDDAASYTWPSAEPKMRIDHIWLSRDDWVVAQGSARVFGDESLSDHRAVIVEVRRVQ